MRRIIHTCGLLICLIACQPNSLDSVQTGAPIYIAASIGDEVMTKAPYVPKNNQGQMVESPSPEYPLQTDVWGSTDQFIFKEEFYDAEKKQPCNGSDDSGKVAIHTDATFQSGEPQLLRAAIYNKDTKPTVYFVAFSPMSQEVEKWTTEDGKTASFVFSGNDDVMFAPQVKGTYAQDYSKSPLLHFSHLLTWLRLEFKAESKEVSDSWGAIRSMTLKSSNKVTINLEEQAYQTDQSTQVSTYDFEGKDNVGKDNIFFAPEKIDMNFYKVIDEDSYVGSQVTSVKKYTDEVFPQVSDKKLIPYLQTEELAYVLCAPVTGQGKIVVDGEDVDSPEYYIDLDTEKRTVSIPVDLRVFNQTANKEEPFLENSRGCQFTITLNFKMGNTVYVACSANNWKVGGLVIGGIGDDELQTN